MRVKCEKSYLVIHTAKWRESTIAKQMMKEILLIFKHKHDENFYALKNSDFSLYKELLAVFSLVTFFEF